jgi:hypothetical protein
VSIILKCTLKTKRTNVDRIDVAEDRKVARPCGHYNEMLGFKNAKNLFTELK